MKRSIPRKLARSVSKWLNRVFGRFLRFDRNNIAAAYVTGEGIEIGAWMARDLRRATILVGVLDEDARSRILTKKAPEWDRCSTFRTDLDRTVLKVSRRVSFRS